VMNAPHESGIRRADTCNSVVGRHDSGDLTKAILTNRIRRHTINIWLYGVGLCITVLVPIVIARHDMEPMSPFEQLLNYGTLLVVAVILFVLGARQNTSRIVTMLGARLVVESEMPELLEAVRIQSARVGINEPAVYLTDEECLTAVTVGWSTRHSVIIINSKAVDALETEELYSLLAQNICRIRSHDYLSRIALIMVFGTWLLVFGDLLLRIPLDILHEVLDDIKSPERVRPIFTARRLFYLVGLVLLLPLLPIVWIVGFFIRQLLQEQEYRADARCVRLIGNPNFLARAIAKLTLASENPVDSRPKIFMFFDVVPPTCKHSTARRWISFLRGSPVGLGARRIRRLTGQK